MQRQPDGRDERQRGEGRDHRRERKDENEHERGYKAAATNVAAQRQMDVDGPFFGTLLGATSHKSPATFVASQFTLRIVEAEFGFEMGADVPASPIPYTAESIAPFVSVSRKTL